MFTISRTVLFNFTRGNGATHLDILNGTVSLIPTSMRLDPPPADTPDPLVVQLVDGVASIPNVEPSPDPKADRTVEWAYLLRVENLRKTDSWEYLVGVPDDTADISYTLLPRYFKVSPVAIGSAIPGPRGVDGPKGDRGAQGIQGIQGVQGLPGPMGERGATGLTGAQGAQGDQGATGAAGPQGLQGIKGDTGAQGLTGLNGAQGLPGVRGIQGIAGEKGDTGLAGAQGIRGVQGEQGIQGVKGDTGAQGLRGLQGLQGIQGVAGVGVTTSTASVAANAGWTGTFNGTVTKQGIFTHLALQIVNPAGNPVAVGTEVIVGIVPAGFRPTGRGVKLFVGDNSATTARAPRHAFLISANGNIGWTPLVAPAGNWTMDFSTVY